MSEYHAFVLALGAVYALLCLSIVTLTGWTGQLNLHVAALGLGVGAYAAFALTVAGVPPLIAVLLAGPAVTPLAVPVAAIAVRFRGLELAVATLALGLILERLVFRNVGKALGGSSSFESSFVAMPAASLFGFRFASDTSMLFLALVVSAIAFGLTGIVARGRTGRALAAVRDGELAAEVLGVPVRRYRIGAFVFSMAIAATAGALFAALKSGIAPDEFNLDLSFQVLAVTVLGGIRRPLGAAIAGVTLAVLPEIVRWGPLQILDGERLSLLFGVAMVVVLWRRPEGIAGALAARAGGTAPAPTEGSTDITRRSVVERPRAQRVLIPSILRVDGVRVSFGGVRALDDVSLTVRRGEVCALIGPNGAGKSTLFNVVSGVVTPEAGRVYLDGADVTELAPHRRAARGLARTFQDARVFGGRTVHENVLIAAHRLARTGPVREAMGSRVAAEDARRAEARAAEVLAWVGLTSFAGVRAGDLPLGLARLLQTAMALAARPSLLLLDEPSAGLDDAETDAFAGVIGRCVEEAGASVLIVEHDMALVSAVADHVYVLELGRVLAEGPARHVRRDPRVIETYLGSSAPAAVTA